MFDAGGIRIGYVLGSASMLVNRKGIAEEGGVEWTCWRSIGDQYLTGLLEGAQSRKNSKAFLELGGSWSLKNAKGVRGQSSKNSETASEQKRGCPLTVSLQAILDKLNITPRKEDVMQSKSDFRKPESEEDLRGSWRKADEGMASTLAKVKPAMPADFDGD